MMKRIEWKIPCGKTGGKAQGEAGGKEEGDVVRVSLPSLVRPWGGRGVIVPCLALALVHCPDINGSVGVMVTYDGRNSNPPKRRSFLVESDACRMWGDGIEHTSRAGQAPP